VQTSIPTVALPIAALSIFLDTLGAKGRLDKAPDFPSQDPRQWIAPPQNWKALEGKIVILDVWTFGCINCVRTIPWVREWKSDSANAA
jgi:thiol-disulfide isomerase/thioredoxin